MTLALSLNPGLPLLIGALAVLLAPQTARGAISACATSAAFALLFVQDFGQSAASAQFGLSLVPMRMDALAQTFGLGFLLIAALLALHGMDGRAKTEEAALLGQSGGAVMALFAGDLVSFIAAAEVAAFAAAALLMTRSEAAARRAGLAMLGWQAFGAVALLAGAAIVIASGNAPLLSPLSPMSPAGALIAIGLWVKAAGPGAHFWLKNAVARTSAAGTAALIAFTPTLALYAGIRLFEGAPILMAFGLAACVLAAFYGALERDPVRGAAHAIIAQLGIAWIAVGLDAPSAAAAHAVCATLAITALIFAIGEARDRALPDDEAARRGAMAVWRALPFSAGAAMLASLSLVGAPIFAGTAGLVLVFKASASFGAPGVLALTGIVGVAAAFGAFKLCRLAFFGPDRRAVLPGPLSGAQFAMVSASALIVAIGLYPDWLREFLPPTPGRTVVRLDLVLFAQSMIVAIALVAAGVFVGRLRPPRRAAALDAAIGAAMAASLGVAGRAVVSAHAAWRLAEAELVRRLSAAAERVLALLDRPSGPMRREALLLLIAVSAFASVFALAGR